MLFVRCWVKYGKKIDKVKWLDLQKYNFEYKKFHLSRKESLRRIRIYRIGLIRLGSDSSKKTKA